MTREELIKIARRAVEGVHRPADCENPVSYDPPEWVVEALSNAYRRGFSDGGSAGSGLYGGLDPAPPAVPVEISEGNKTPTLRRPRRKR